MYIDAVCKGIDEIPDIDPAARERYNLKFSTEGIESLRAELKLVDPDYYARVDLRNHKRIIRALEIFETTGCRYSDFLTKKRTERDFKIIRIGLQRERQELYSRINGRVDEMIRQGLEEEARELFDLRELNPLKCVGYSEFFEFFQGKISREKAIELIKRNSRRYAKRQITWWNRDKEIVWFSPDKVQDIILYIGNSIKS
jgi:tRNA dimethylallyltransferase